MKKYQALGNKLTVKEQKSLYGGIHALPPDDDARCSCANGTQGSAKCTSCHSGADKDGKSVLYCDGKVDVYC